MDSSRRSFDRSREPGLKKPRLTEELNARPLVPRTIGPVVNPVQPRFRASGADLESNDAIREAYQPQPLPLHQQHQELVEQYKTALAELTFNSKPIITNLTIIAGENLHAAKAIVATICSNILEVPSDQKLPSLYLLDSIVKNIGRDYIKYFAARLPEVFCKAYRQVDPSVHQSMIHLFGTWKGVFHPHTLQYIEREIGIVSSSNGSLGSTASRSDAQSQRPAHSIHVNPKYLVERQRLQQSSRAKVNEITGALANSEDVEGLDGASSVNAGHSWEDRPVKMHNIQHLHRDPLGEPVQEKNVPYANYDYGSQMPRSSALGSARAIGKVSEQGIGKPRYGAGGSVAHSSSSQRNGFSMKPGFPSYPPSKSANVDSHLQPSHGIASRSASGISSSWKNSEEEEFSWDSMEHRSIDRNVTNIPSISRKDHWVSGGSDEMGLKPNLANPSSKDVLIPAGTTNNLGHSEGYTVRVGGSPSRLSSFPRAKHLGPGFSTSSGSSGVTGSQRIQSLGSAPLSGRLLPYQHSPSHSDTRLLHQPMENLVEQGAPSQIPPRSDFRSSKLSEMAIAGTHNQYIQEPLSKFRLKELKPSSALPLQNRNHPPFLQQPQSEPAVQEIVGQTKKQLLREGSECEIAPTVGNFTSGRGSDPEYSEQLSQRNLSADNVEGGVVSGDGATSLSGPSFSDTRSKPSKVGIKPSLATRPSPTHLVSSGLEDAPLTAVVTHCEDKSIPLEASQGKVGRSPLQPGPRPAVMVDSAADQSSSAVETTANPVSSLLSSLILKGLISTSKPEPTTSVPSQITMQVQNQGQDNAATGIGPDSSASVSTAIPASSAEDEGPIMEQVAKCSTALSQQSTGEIKNLIGFEFKPTVIREFNDSVISELFDDLPHRCEICGLQLKLQDHVDRHLAWHDSRNSESKRPSAGSRRWYADLPDWIAWTSNSTFESEYAGMEEKSDETTEMQGPMVPADESQCACILCGEPFDDIYNLERDEWMFKGAVYLDIQPANGKISDRSHSTLQGPIVHESCISESTLQDLGLANEIKLEKDA